jgi:hypothetical protein
MELLALFGMWELRVRFSALVPAGVTEAFRSFPLPIQAINLKICNDSLVLYPSQFLLTFILPFRYIAFNLFSWEKFVK